jgi:acyl-CoA thioester hydrolase
MFISETQVRVRYAETDQMGYVYYGNYAQYYEVGRVEALRTLGMSYKAMEDSGIMLPVVSFSIKYARPAFYDDLITIKTTIPEVPSVKIRFLYEAYNEKGELLNSGETVLVFINRKSNRPCAASQDFLDKLRKYFPVNG